MNYIEYTAINLPNCSKVFVPIGREISDWSHPEIIVYNHEYEFAEYRDSFDDILLRHTLGVI